MISDAAIEAAAKALARRHWAKLDPDAVVYRHWVEGYWRPFWHDFIDDARACLEAAQEMSGADRDHSRVASDCPGR